MKLYYSKGACSLSVRILLHELGLSFESEAVNLKTKMTESGLNYLDINPKGAVPALLTDDNQVLTENVAIQLYLVDKYQATKLLPPINDFKRYQILEKLSYLASDVHKSFSPFFNSKIPPEEHTTIFLPLLKNKFDILEKFVGNYNYLCGNEFTLPDCYCFVLLRWTKVTGLELEHYPNLNRYFIALKKRPSIEASLAEEQISG